MFAVYVISIALADSAYINIAIHVCRTSREQALKERVLQHSKTLQGQRKQARLISSPSTDLLQAEKNLAEVRPHHTGGRASG